MSLTEQSLYTNNAQIQNQIRNLASFSDPSRVQRGGLRRLQRAMEIFTLTRTRTDFWG